MPTLGCRDRPNAARRLQEAQGSRPRGAGGDYMGLGTHSALQLQRVPAQNGAHATATTPSCPVLLLPTSRPSLEYAARICCKHNAFTCPASLLPGQTLPLTTPHTPPGMDGGHWSVHVHNHIGSAPPPLDYAAGEIHGREKHGCRFLVLRVNIIRGNPRRFPNGFVNGAA